MKWIKESDLNRSNVQQRIYCKGSNKHMMREECLWTRKISNSIIVMNKTYRSDRQTFNAHPILKVIKCRKLKVTKDLELK